MERSMENSKLLGKEIPTKVSVFNLTLCSGRQNVSDEGYILIEGPCFLCVPKRTVLYLLEGFAQWSPVARGVAEFQTHRLR